MEFRINIKPKNRKLRTTSLRRPSNSPDQAQESPYLNQPLTMNVSGN